jgi:hypothetical protein
MIEVDEVNTDLALLDAGEGLHEELLGRLDLVHGRQRRRVWLEHPETKR